jgi:ribosomal protein S12 methylthiotransferase
MHTRGFRKKKVKVITLGCPKNTVDSEVLLGQLHASGIITRAKDQAGDASTVIINTCGFIEAAREESIDTILHFVEQKRTGRIEKVIVTGCLSQRYMPALRQAIPEVDEFFGTHDLPHLLRSVGADYKQELLGERLLTTPAHYAYLKISEGCDRPCSFCAIPLMRGKHRSRPVEEIIAEARQLVKKGSREIILIAQDSTYYGLDLYGKRKLAELMNHLADIEGLEWLRLHYAFPAGFPPDVLEVMADRSNICRYLDIPLQHASDRILASMRRGITRQKTQKLIETIRSKVPGIAIRTTMITGYPDETEKDFEDLISFVRQMRFERLGVFTYSHEENTAAFRLQDNVPFELKQQRAEELMTIQQEISEENNKRYIGQTLKVLIDRKEGHYWIGRTEFDSPEIDNEVRVECPANSLKPGVFVNVKITSAEAFDLYGSAILS